MRDQIPKYYEFFNPVLEAIASMGGSGTIDEIVEATVSAMGLPESIVETPHGETNQTEVAYRIAWARSYLKKDGWLQNSQRGVWTLTSKARAAGRVDPAGVKRRVRQQYKTEPSGRGRDARSNAAPMLGNEESESDVRWQEKALRILKTMDPVAFERLCQRLLRESGFVEVEVTRRSADGGIDGRGILRLNGLISFTVMFQSKRYAGAVGSSVVRDFRGALMGRADKGLIITTGRYTTEARREATRDGATPIDLIDGLMLVEKLKALELGISTRVVEVVDVDEGWFGEV